MTAVIVGSLRKGAAPIPCGFQPVRVDRQTPLGNPYPEKEHGRDGCIALYRNWLNVKLADPGNPASIQFASIQRRIMQGESIALMCWCAPLNCHGDVIKELLEVNQ